MILKPYSNKMNISYKSFLSQNYFVAVNGKGLKKINLKGINMIAKAADPDCEEIKESDIIKRNFADLELTPELVCPEEKPLLAEIVNSRLAMIYRNSEQSVSFYNLGAAFSTEVFDTIWLFELGSEEAEENVNAVKEELRSLGKSEVIEKWIKTADKYLLYLENPADLSLLSEVKKDAEGCIGEYENNLFAHFLLGLIHLKPSQYFDTQKAAEEMSKAGNISANYENKYSTALCDYILGWISYISSDYKKAIEYSLSSIEKEFINIPEVYFNTAKFYAAVNDADNSIKYLDEAVQRFDFIYAVKADIDDDFNNIKPELVKYFIKLRDEKKSNLLQRLKDLGIEFTQDIGNI